jgi:DnaA family protein
MSAQLSLAVSLRDDCQLDNFLVVPEANKQIVSFLRDDFGMEREHFVFLWGKEGSGRSHLLQGACHHWADKGKSVQYLPLAQLAGLDPEQVIAGLENVDLVCIDEINLVTQQQKWAEVLFHFYNRSREYGTCLLVSADVPPAGLIGTLADLQSRLSMATVFQMSDYTDTDKAAILHFRAERLGLQLSEEASEFLLRRAPRGLEELMQMLRDLDVISLAQQRKLSIPFIKQVFGW